MAKKNKWQVEELHCTKQVKKTASIILKNRIEGLQLHVEKYFNDCSNENLHDIRIALRRLRYSMELFFQCYDKKYFMRFYNKVQMLQDLSGSIRDIDITVEIFNSFNDVDVMKINDQILSKSNEKKRSFEEKFKFELKKFIAGKSFKNFYKQNI